MSLRLFAAVAPVDSIDHAAQDEDFIHASLLVIGPGDNVVTCFGHAAIRMQCPTHQLDYCFTFEMKLAEGEHMKFLTGQAKAGFIVAPTPAFFSQYMDKGRGITEYDLNLSPSEKQLLWRNLDQEVKRDVRWPYDFITVNCGSMCVWIIEKSLQDERIVYHQLPSILQSSYGDVMDYIAKDAPWMNLYFHLRYFSQRNDLGRLNDKMAPPLLAEAWQQATFTDSKGNCRPVITASRQLAPQTLEVHSVWLTPMRTLIIVLILFVLFIILFKTKLMKRLFTTSKRLVLTTALVLTSVLTSFAGGEDWYAYNVQVDAYPTGAGLVYVDMEQVYDEIDYKASWNREYVSTSTSAYGYAVANDGWHLLGFTKDELDAEGNKTQVDSVMYKIEEWSGAATLTLEGVSSSHWDEDEQAMVSDDSLTLAGMMPLEPNNYFRALFTHAYATVAPGYEYLAKVGADKLVNNIGDKVKLTATPLCDYTSFVNWTKDGEVVSTNSTLEVTVTGVEEYVANFTDTRNLTVKFPEDGGYVPFFSEFSYGLSNTGVMAYSPSFLEDYENNCLVDTVSAEGARASFLNMTGGEYQTGGMMALLLYGYGDVTLVPNDTTAASEPYNVQLFRWSGETRLTVDGLDQSLDKYYAYDQVNQRFNLMTTGSIAANSLYMVMPDSLMAEGQSAPAVIYLDEASSVAGINGTKIQKASQKQIYNLAGRRMDAMNREGIYVFDGKKVVYRKK